MKRNNKPVVRFKIYPKTHYIGRCTELPAPIITSSGRYNDRHRKHTAFVEAYNCRRRVTVADKSRYRGEASRTESEASGSEETYERDSRCEAPTDDYDDYEEEGEDEDEEVDEDEDEDGGSSSSTKSRSSSDDESNIDEAEVAKALAAFRKCDEFLQKHRIRPEFFCRYRERLALQAWLLQRVTAKASRSVSGTRIHK